MQGFITLNDFFEFLHPFTNAKASGNPDAFAFTV